MSGRNRVETGKKPDTNLFGFYRVLYGFYLFSNFILRDLSGSIRFLSGKWQQKIISKNILPGLTRLLSGKWSQILNIIS